MRNYTFICRLVVAISCFIFTSCGSYNYYTSNQNVLKFKEKGDVSCQFGTDRYDSKSFNLGYALTNNIALLTEFQAIGAFNTKSKIDNYIWNNELILFKKMDNSFIPAVNFGYSYGQIQRNSDLWSLEMNKFFLQPSIGYSRKYFDIALSARLSKVDYNFHPTDLYINILESGNEPTDYFQIEESGFYFFEPAITLGAGFENFKLRYQYIITNKLNSSELEYTKNNFFITITATFNLNKIIKKNGQDK
jgi:hypothetical protein